MLRNRNAKGFDKHLQELLKAHPKIAREYAKLFAKLPRPTQLAIMRRRIAITGKLGTIKIGKNCSICGTQMTVFVYADGKYRGGHYFGKIPIERLKKEKQEIEYWECPNCYWGKKKRNHRFVSRR